MLSISKPTNPSCCPPWRAGDVLLTPPLPCVLATASSEYLQSIACLLRYSLWIKARYFLASPLFLSCLLLAVTLLPSLPRLLVGLSSFCLLVGFPIPYSPLKCLSLSHTFPFASPQMSLSAAGMEETSNFSFLALDLLESKNTHKLSLWEKL